MNLLAEPMQGWTISASPAMQKQVLGCSGGKEQPGNMFVAMVQAAELRS